MALDTGATIIEKAQLVIVDRMSVLGKEARNVECVVHDLPEGLEDSKL